MVTEVVQARESVKVNGTGWLEKEVLMCAKL